VTATSASIEDVSDAPLFSRGEKKVGVSQVFSTKAIVLNRGYPEGSA
jgi:hypothetical protein